jgi:3-mercaptopyruvate sulfurtransferase SseA
LKGGISEWIAASLPTETKEAPRQAPPAPGALKG